MSHFEFIEPVFRGYIAKNARLKELATGFEWTEGPVWFGDAGCLLFSEIPSNRIYRWTQDGGLSTFRTPSNHANGHTRDREGRLISCEHGARRVTRTEYDGSITVIADSWQGKRLNSPNDVVVASDGAIWFTDPHYGIASNFEGHAAEQELPCQVYRVDRSGEMTAVATDFACPNGLCFSHAERRLYIADTGRFATDDPTHIRVFDVDGGRLTGGEIFHVITPGKADGMRVDTDGNVWSSAADGIHCLSPEGVLLGKIKVPQTVSNLCFGGHAKHILFITATTSVYSIVVNRQGVQRP